MTATETLDNLVFSCTTSLFKAYGQPLAEVPRTPHTPPPPELCAVIGFSGPDLSGALMIAADPGPIAASRPTPTASNRDWLAELANQLLGRIKNRLLPTGVEIYPTTPIVLRGERIAPLGRNGDLPGVVFAAESGGQIVVWLDFTARDDLRLDRSLQALGPIPREGEMVWF